MLKRLTPNTPPRQLPSFDVHMRAWFPPGTQLRRLIEISPQRIRSEGAQARRTRHAIFSAARTSIRGTCHYTIRVPLDLWYNVLQTRLLPT